MLLRSSGATSMPPSTRTTTSCTTDLSAHGNYSIRSIKGYAIVSCPTNWHTKVCSIAMCWSIGSRYPIALLSSTMCLWDSMPSPSRSASCSFIFATAVVPTSISTTRTPISPTQRTALRSSAKITCALSLRATQCLSAPVPNVRPSPCYR